MAAILATDTLRLPESAEEIREQLLTDTRLELRNVGITDPEVSVAPGTDTYIWATAQANCGFLQFTGIGQLRPSLTPLYATGQDLERWRMALKLPVVQPTGAIGRITVKVNGGASISIPQGQQFVLPNGLRGQASTTHSGVTDGSDVSVEMVDTGSKTNADPNTIVRWINPPFNLETQGRVSVNRPLTGGYDAETDSRKRERVLNRLGNSPGGGNFGQLREIAFNELASVQNCLVHPALGGPSSTKVILLKDFDEERNDFSREFDSTAAAFVRNKIQETVSEGVDMVVTAAADEEVDIALAITLPPSSLAGGSGTGWVDAVPWPAPATPTRVRVSTVVDSRNFTIDPITAVAPTNGVTRIAWWSPQDRRFRVGIVTANSGSSGAWVVTVQEPFVDSTNNTIAPGDYVSPAAEGLDNYRTTLLAICRALASGENTADVNRLPRSQRNPTVSDGGADSDITNGFAARFIRDHSEISDAAMAYTSQTTPTVPASVDDPPNVLIPRHFGVYVQ